MVACGLMLLYLGFKCGAGERTVGEPQRMEALRVAKSKMNSDKENRFRKLQTEADCIERCRIRVSAMSIEYFGVSGGDGKREAPKCHDIIVI